MQTFFSENILIFVAGMKYLKNLKLETDSVYIARKHKKKVFKRDNNHAFALLS